MIESAYHFERYDAPHMVNLEYKGKVYQLTRGLGTYKFYDGTEITLGMTMTFVGRSNAAPDMAAPHNKESK